MRCHWSTLYQEFLYRNLELSIRIINFDCPIFSFWTLDNSHTWVQHQSPETKGHQAGRRHDCCCVIFRWPPSRRAARSPLSRGEAADQDQVPRSEVSTLPAPPASISTACATSLMTSQHLSTLQNDLITIVLIVCLLISHWQNWHSYISKIVQELRTYGDIKLNSYSQNHRW